MKKAIKQSTLLTALNLGTIVLVLMMTAAFVLSISTNKRAMQMYEDEKELTLAAQQFLDASGYLTDQARASAATGNITYYNNYQYEVNVAQNREVGYSRMEAIGLTAEEEAIMAEMSQISNDLVPLGEKAMSAAMTGDIQTAIQYVFGTAYTTNLSKIQSLQEEFVQSFQNRMAAEIERQQIYVVVVQVIVIVFMCIIVLFQLLSTLFVRKKVIRPLKLIQGEMTEFSKGNMSATVAMEADTSELGMLVHSVNRMRETLRGLILDIENKLTQMAKGDLNIQMDVEYIGDFADIENSIKQISMALSDALREINIASDQVSAGADQVASGAQALSQGATEQASSVEELSATLQNINEKIGQNAQSADSVSALTIATGNKIHQSKQKMQDLVNAMEEIKQTSQQIQGIVKAIDDIAFQTNILALNAAVEAARAGSAGKGFAVVADEVRNLAGKSAEASKNTQELIQNSIQAVEHGSVLAIDASQVLEETAVDAERVMESIKQIAEASAEEAQATSQIALGLDQVASVVQTNSATAEQSAAASQELSGQASMLRSLVGQFKLVQERSGYAVEKPAAYQPDVPAVSFSVDDSKY